MGAKVLTLWRMPLNNGNMLVLVVGLGRHYPTQGFYLTIICAFGLKQRACLYHSLGSRA